MPIYRLCIHDVLAALCLVWGARSKNLPVGFLGFKGEGQANLGAKRLDSGNPGPGKNDIECSCFLSPSRVQGIVQL